MAAGFRDGSWCYATAAEALDAHFSGAPIPATIEGNIVYSSYFFKDATGWKINSQMNQGAYVQNLIFAVPSITPPSCTFTVENTPLQDFTDGTLLGWGVVAAMVAAWAITVLRRAVS